MKASVGKTLMVLANNPFPQDRRVYQEAICLANNGWQVEVIAPRAENQPYLQDIEGIQVYRFDFPRALRWLPLYILEHLYAPWALLWGALKSHRRERLDIIHAHNPPDTLFLIGLFFKMLGCKFVFDHHDLTPELYLSRFGKKARKVVYYCLLLLERMSCQVADVVIATNQSYREVEIQRSKVAPERVFIVRNGPDLRRLRHAELRTDFIKSIRGKILLFYLGEMNPQDGVDYLLRALHYLKFILKRSDFYCVLVGKGDALNDLKRLASELDLQENVYFTGWIPDEEMLQYFSTADICVDPDPSSPLNDKSTWIKIMEYMAMGKPIVAFRLLETYRSAQDAALYAEPNDEADFAKKICILMDDPKLRKTLGEMGRKRVEQELSWDIVSRNLLEAYAFLKGLSS